MMLGTVRPTRHRSAARVSRGWLVRGVRHERDGCQLDGIHYPQEGEGSRIALIPNAAARPEDSPDLKRRLSIFSALILDSSVDDGTPSRAAALFETVQENSFH
jgi:hypothetical protein